MRDRNVYAWLERSSRSNTLPPTAMTNVKSFFPVDQSNHRATAFEVMRISQPIKHHPALSQSRFYSSQE